jgi:hypothetical protein
LATTLELVLNHQFLWRSARNRGEPPQLIAHVKELRPGDEVLIAWRHKRRPRAAYLLAKVAEPLHRAEPGLAIDRLTGPAGEALLQAGYPATTDGAVEGIRLDDVQECWFEVKAPYPGQNAIHALDKADADAISGAGPIPPQVFVKTQAARSDGRTRTSRKRSTAAHSTHTLQFPPIEPVVDELAFDAYVMVDWSSAAKPVSGTDSIWIGCGEWWKNGFRLSEPLNVSTRLAAIDYLLRRLERWKRQRKRVLVGLDFAFGYPAGFAAALGTCRGPGAWRGLHRYIARGVTDTVDNVNNRHRFAAECNEKVGAPGPFWGCSASAATASLTQHRVGVFTFPHRGLDEWRLTDLQARQTATVQSVWKLNCGVSVGGQTLLGIAHLYRLSTAIEGHLWPFEGWRVPDGPVICFAEIFPSLVQYPEWADEYARRRDRTQVLGCVRCAAERDAVGLLRKDFTFAVEHKLTLEQRRRAQHEEGWILWCDRDKPAEEAEQLRRDMGR